MLTALTFQRLIFSAAFSPSARRVAPIPLISPQMAVESTMPNGEASQKDLKKHIGLLQNKTVAIDESKLLPSSPPLVFRKYLTMQDKRVRVSIRYSIGGGLKPYFLTGKSIILQDVLTSTFDD